MNITTRAKILIFVFVILVSVLAFFSTSALNQSQAASLEHSVSGIKPTTLSIFFNNAGVDLVEFIPFLGPAFGVYVSYNTGLAIAAIAQTSTLGGISGFEAFLALLITPIFWMEFFAYSLAIEESIALVVSSRNKQYLKSELKWLAGSLFIAISVLFVSAHLEASMVTIFQ